MIPILVVDDHPIVLEGIRSVLSRKGYKVIKARDKRQALMLAEDLSELKVFVVDVSLDSDSDGLELVEEIRAAGITKPVVVYTMHEEQWNINRLITMEVEGVVLKGDDIKELVRAVDCVAHGGTYRSDAFKKRSADVKQVSGVLSVLDIEVLDRISRGESNKKISTSMGITEKAVEYHRCNILRKLCSKNMIEATRRAVSLGILAILSVIMVAPAGASHPEAIDLGLSVLWADRNLDADSPMEAGGFYAFGETWTKECYDWVTYAFCDEASLLLQHDFGCEDISATDYDAAHVKLGNGWRMPTIEEFTELLESCTVSVKETDGVAYRIFTAENGESLMFPMPGYMNRARLLYVGQGVYWTSFVEKEEMEEDGILYRCNSPYYVGMTKDAIYKPTYGSAHLGQSIRPVRNRNTGIGEVGDCVGSEASIVAIYTVDGVRVASSDLSDVAPGLYIVVYSDGRVAKFRH